MITPTRRVRALKALRWQLRRRGWDVVHYTGGMSSAQKWALAHHRVDLVVDVGANEGQYVRELRLAGYEGDALSFEPGSTAFAHLSAGAAGDPRWEVVRAAVSDAPGTARLGVSLNLQSSSLLALSPDHARAAPNAEYTAYEDVPVEALDDRGIDPARRVWLKLDCQGSERAVLDGATRLLEQVQVVQCEMSLVPMYDGEDTIATMLTRFESLGFHPVWIDHGYLDPESGLALQAEVLLARRTV